MTTSAGVDREVRTPQGTQPETDRRSAREEKAGCGERGERRQWADRRAKGGNWAKKPRKGVTLVRSQRPPSVPGRSSAEKAR